MFPMLRWMNEWRKMHYNLLLLMLDFITNCILMSSCLFFFKKQRTTRQYYNCLCVLTTKFFVYSLQKHFSFQCLSMPQMSACITSFIHTLTKLYIVAYHALWKNLRCWCEWIYVHLCLWDNVKGIKLYTLSAQGLYL